MIRQKNNKIFIEFYIIYSFIEWSMMNKESKRSTQIIIYCVSKRYIKLWTQKYSINCVFTPNFTENWWKENVLSIFYLFFSSFRRQKMKSIVQNVKISKSKMKKKINLQTLHSKYLAVFLLEIFTKILRRVKTEISMNRSWIWPVDYFSIL